MATRRAVINPEKCDRAPGCPVKKVCPASAVEREETDEPYFVNSYCQGCGICINKCPKQAVEMV